MQNITIKYSVPLFDNYLLSCWAKNNFSRSFSLADIHTRPALASGHDGGGNSVRVKERKQTGKEY